MAGFDEELAMPVPQQQQAPEDERDRGSRGDAVRRMHVEAMHVFASRARVASDIFIIFSAAQMGACLQEWNTATETSYARHQLCEASTHIICYVFLAETVARLAWHRRAYFQKRGNLLDLLLVVMMFAGLWIWPLVQEDEGEDVRFLVLQCSRIFRLIEVLRQKEEVKLLMAGLSASMKSMLWLVILFVILLYCTSVFCVTLFHDVDLGSDYSFKTLPMAMLTTFTLGILADWVDIICPTFEAYWWSPVFFIVFVFFTNFSLLNQVIGIITERTMASKEESSKHLEYEEKCKRMRKIDNIIDFLFPGTSAITVDLMESIAAKEEFAQAVGELVANIDLPVGYEIWDCLALFDKDHNGIITVTEFKEGIYGLIFNTDTQRSFAQKCTIASSVAGLQRCVKTVEGHLLAEIRAEFGRLRQELSVSVGPGNEGDIVDVKLSLEGDDGDISMCNIDAVSSPFRLGAVHLPSRLDTAALAAADTKDLTMAIQQLQKQVEQLQAPTQPFCRSPRKMDSSPPMPKRSDLRNLRARRPVPSHSPCAAMGESLFSPNTPVSHRHRTPIRTPQSTRTAQTTCTRESFTRTHALVRAVDDAVGLVLHRSS